MKIINVFNSYHSNKVRFFRIRSSMFDFNTLEGLTYLTKPLQSTIGAFFIDLKDITL
jgi:hypothetical protein